MDSPQHNTREEAIQFREALQYLPRQIFYQDEREIRIKYDTEAKIRLCGKPILEDNKDAIKLKLWNRGIPLVKSFERKLEESVDSMTKKNKIFAKNYCRSQLSRTRVDCVFPEELSPVRAGSPPIYRYLQLNDTRSLSPSTTTLYKSGRFIQGSYQPKYAKNAGNSLFSKTWSQSSKGTRLNLTRSELSPHRIQLKINEILNTQQRLETFKVHQLLKYWFYTICDNEYSNKRAHYDIK